MSTDKGYVKIYRNIWKHWIWKSNRPFDEFHAWVDLIMLANHKRSKTLFDGKLIYVGKGSFITSLRKLANRWGWGKTHVSEFLEMLEKDGMISVSADSKKTTITLVNYGIYQGKGMPRADTDEDTDRDTDEDTDRDADKTQTINSKYTIEGTIEKKDAPAEPVVDDDDEGEDPLEILRRWEEENGDL